ncbi:MAG: hypothetical protein OEM00_03225 [Burkholderiaceae bacterium]|nr:hypothetical protein [Burkholderiaceae bacterium]
MAVFTPQPLSPLTDYAPGVRALGLLGVGCAWWLLTGRNEQMANASSLHSFYRERLTRAYLAVCNPQRGVLSALAAHDKADVTKVVQNDDLDMRKYRPELKGGPIHLVNACLNQTRDDSSGLYNADRKGALLTVSSRAIEVGTRVAVPLPATKSAMVSPSADVGTLGRWVAVSGAAASPGAGSYTSFGWAVLLFFLGLRLGYWMRAPHGAQGTCPTGLMRLWKWAVKPLMLGSEVSATFFGRARPWWYLSDGSHFENTGVYALLKRRLDFIIVADNGADPDYQFGDLENLVRKARIDFGAEIEFYTREEAARHFPDNDGRITVLSPQDMADNHSVRGVMLARVRYAPDAEGALHEATLLIVKPNQHDALDLDLLAYAQRHPAFPHESTGDQSFDEAQWESYQRLGEDLGRALNPAWLKQLPGWLTQGKHPLTVGARLRTAPPLPQAAKANEPPQPLSRRSARNSAIGATLGLGASGTLLLALWQVSEDMRQARATEQAETRQMFTEVSRDLRNLDGACPKVADHTTAQLTMLREMRSGTTLRPVERAGVDQLLDRVREECAKPAALSSDCQNAARHARVGVCAAATRPAVVGTALSYWHPSPAPITLSSLLFGPAEQPQVRVSDSTVAPQPSSSQRPTQALPAEVVPPRPSASAALTGAPVAALADACARDEGPVQLYVRIYDEASRNDATALARLLQEQGGRSLLLAPVEDVTRSAALRQQSRPVPWPQPTLIVHEAADQACALSLARAISDALAVQDRNEGGKVWLRALPKSLKPRPGVIELWLPPMLRDQTNFGGG